MGEDARQLVKRAWQGETEMQQVNMTNVAQFRPIALCNILYKILSKTMENKLKHILLEVISETQSVFVPGRLMTDNALTLWKFSLSEAEKQGNKGACALKLDMSKAYDRQVGISKSDDAENGIWEPVDWPCYAMYYNSGLSTS